VDNFPPEEIVRSAVQLSSSRLRRQHELAARFAVTALRLPRLRDVLDEACYVVSQGIGSRFAKVLRFLPEENLFLLEHGVGWNAADIGVARLGADEASPAGFAHLTGRPVISNHLGQEHRFRTPELLIRYGIERAINVPIRGAPLSYGVLEADSTDGDDFIETDIVFLESVSSVISMTLERSLARSEANRSELFSAQILNASIDCIVVLSNQGSIEFINDSGQLQMGVEDFSQLVGTPWVDRWPASDRQRVEAALRGAAEGVASRFEAPYLTATDTLQWWDVSVAPIRNPDACDESVSQIVAVCRDVTERHEHELKLNRLISDRDNQLDMSDLMMKEVHHRVRNSLQLVQTLLFLQASLSGDESVKSQLKIAANRVQTVASVHQRLYQDNGIEATDAADYLAGLIEDLRGSFKDRPMSLDAPSMVLPANRLAPLGLIVCELVTNALKYGQGLVSVTLERDDAAVWLSVCDEGNGFPDNFPVPQGTGLGMRLVRTYAGFGTESVLVDRSVPFSKIVVKFKV
jgi:PAS domain S-box-containing protein